MQELYLYRDDFLGDPDVGGNLRDVEDSAVVVRNWFDDHVRYAVEDIPDERCLRLVAERLVVRRMLGLSHLETDYESRVARIEVFGSGTPLFSELVMPSVFIAMAFVPLKAMGGNGRPRLARLYCVGGLTKHHVLSLEGMGEPELQDFSWFLGGVPSHELERGIGGRSWLLAAYLLAEVVRKRDIQTARNLATHFFVTGNVECGNIRMVDLGNKVNLVKVEQFENFKWIIPKENDMNIPKRKIEKPATLEEAYKLIESMQSIATRSLFNALHKADIDEAKVQYAQMGADIYALEKDTGLSTLEIVAHEIEKCRKDTSRPEDEREKRIGVLREIMMWLKQENADCAMMFYLLAQSGNETALSSCKERYPINAVDENGLTAVDWALNDGNWDLAKKLFAVGGRCNTRFGGNLKLQRAIEVLCEDQGLDAFWIPNGDRDLIIKAVEMGLSPSVKVAGSSPIRKIGLASRTEEEWEEGRVEATLFGMAVLRHHVEIVATCLEHGADVKTRCHVSEISRDGQKTRFVGLGGGTLIEHVKDRIERLTEDLPPNCCDSIQLCDLGKILGLLEAHGFPAKSPDYE